MPAPRWPQQLRKVSIRLFVAFHWVACFTSSHCRPRLSANCSHNSGWLGEPASSSMRWTECGGGPPRPLFVRERRRDRLGTQRRDGNTAWRNHGGRPVTARRATILVKRVLQKVLAGYARVYFLNDKRFDDGLRQVGWAHGAVPEMVMETGYLIGNLRPQAVPAARSRARRDRAGSRRGSGPRRTGGSCQHQRLVCAQALGMDSGRSTLHADEPQLNHLIGDCEQVGDGWERLAGEGGVKPGNDDSLTQVHQL